MKCTRAQDKGDAIVPRTPSETLGTLMRDALLGWRARSYPASALA